MKATLFAVGCMALLDAPEDEISNFSKREIRPRKHLKENSIRCAHLTHAYLLQAHNVKAVSSMTKILLKLYTPKTPHYNHIGTRIIPRLKSAISRKQLAITDA